MSKQTIENIILKGGDEVTIKVNNKHKFLGVPMYTRYGITNEGKDVLDLVLDLSKGAARMLTELKGKRNTETNMVILEKQDTESERVMMTQALNELIRAGIIRKIPTQKLKNINGFPLVTPKRTFMISPLLLIPRTNEDFALARYYWEQLNPIKNTGVIDESVRGERDEDPENSGGRLPDNVESPSCHETGDV